MDSVGLSGDFHSRSTQVAIHLSDANHLSAFLMSLRVCEIWWKGWIKMVFLKRTTEHGKRWWFKMQNHIKKMCHVTSTSGGYVCPTKTWTSSPAYLTYPYLDMMMWYRTSTHKKSVLFLSIWTVGIGKYRKKRSVWKIGIIHPGQKAAVESDSFWGP